MEINGLARGYNLTPISGVMCRDFATGFWAHFIMTPTVQHFLLRGSGYGL